MRSPLEILRLAINNFTSNRVAFGTATNVTPIGDSEWLEFPYGVSDYWIKERGQWKKYRQIFGLDQAKKMVAAINALRERKGENWRGLPIFVGHPDADPARWPDDKRLGGIMELEAGANSMRFKVAWNAKGEENKQEGYYIYPSPAWLYDLKLAANTGEIIPDELRSVGLTNTPRIPDSPVWTNSEASLFDANNPASPAEDGQPKKDNDMKKTDHRAMLLELLRKHHAPSLAADASDEQLAEAHNAAMEKTPLATNTLELPIGDSNIGILIVGDAPADLMDRLTALNTECVDLRGNVATITTARDEAIASNTAAQADIARFRTLAINSVLDAALNAGRITAAEREGLVADFEKDFEGAQKALGTRKTALNTDRLNLNPAGNALDLTTPAGRQIAFNSLVDEYMRPADKGGKGYASIDAALAAMREVPEHKKVLDAMQPA